MNIDFPFHLDDRGRTATTDWDGHIRDMIEQILFTRPGERVNRLDFGSGLPQLLFAPNSADLAAATQFTVQGALQQWLGDLIEVNKVEISGEDSTLNVVIEYVLRQGEGEAQTAEFSREV